MGKGASGADVEGQITRKGRKENTRSYGFHMLIFPQSSALTLY